MASRDFYRRPFNVFFSYAHADRERASDIVAWLERSGVKAWFDRDRLDSGRPVATTLRRQLRDCRSLIVLLTPASLKAAFARGAATPVHVIARASTPQPRLFRDKVRYYANDVERVGLVHEVAFQYRRRLLDFEVASPFQA